MSGSGSSLKDETHGSVLCLEIENMEWNIVEGPDSHGSRRMVKTWEGDPGDGGK